MKIGIVGCGALGSFYGARLCALGEEVHFLLRSDYDVVRREGVRIRSVEQDLHVHPRCANDPRQIGACDLVLIGLKTTANAAFSRLLPPLLGPHTALVTLQNGLGNEELLAREFGGARVLGGLCFVCLNRVAPGVVVHSAHGDIVLGEFQRPRQERTEEFAALFQRAGIRCQITDNLEKAHWEKLVWNVPFNGLGVAGVAGYEAVIRGTIPPGTVLGPCLDTDRLLGDPNWLVLVQELMHEVISTARKLGFEIPYSAIQHRIDRTREMSAYKASSLIDYERGQAIELESLFLEPLRRARQAGVETPRLAAMCGVLSELDPGSK